MPIISASTSTGLQCHSSSRHGAAVVAIATSLLLLSLFPSCLVQAQDVLPIDWTTSVVQGNCTLLADGETTRTSGSTISPVEYHYTSPLEDPTSTVGEPDVVTGTGTTPPDSWTLTEMSTYTLSGQSGFFGKMSIELTEASVITSVAPHLPDVTDWPATARVTAAARVAACVEEEEDDDDDEDKNEGCDDSGLALYGPSLKMVHTEMVDLYVNQTELYQAICARTSYATVLSRVRLTLFTHFPSATSTMAPGATGPSSYDECPLPIDSSGSGRGATTDAAAERQPPDPECVELGLETACVGQCPASSPLKNSSIACYKAKYGELYDVGNSKWGRACWGQNDTFRQLAKPCLEGDPWLVCSTGGRKGPPEWPFYQPWKPRVWV